MKHFCPETSASLPCCLNLIRSAVYAESHNRILYEYLMNHATDEENKNILTGIRNEETAHENLLRQLYFNLTGQTLPSPKKDSFSPPASYCSGLSHALNRKQESIARSHKIAWCLSNINQSMRMADIASDEMRHSLLYLYLCRNHSCGIQRKG